MKIIAGFLGIKPNFETVPRGFVGIEFDDADGIIVKKVLPGSPAEKAGFKPGDKIETIKTTTIDDRSRPGRRPWPRPASAPSSPSA